MDRDKYRKAVAKAMSEDTLTDHVLEMAARYGWWAHHDTPAYVKGDDKRPFTHLKGNKGVPDLQLTHVQGRSIYRELKTEQGTVTPEQKEWIRRLKVGGRDADVWKPRHWVDGTIEQELKRGSKL